MRTRVQQWFARQPLEVVVLFVYGAARTVSALFIVWAAQHQPVAPGTTASVGYLDMANFWDAGWYRAIAAGGYPSDLPVDPATGLVGENEWAFHPLYPMVARAFMASTGLSFHAVGPTVALLAGGAAVVVVARVLDRRLGRSTAIGSVAVVATFTSSPAFQIAYADSLALLFVAAALGALDRRRWVSSGAFTLLAGMTRPVALPLVAVALYATWTDWRKGDLRQPGPIHVLAGLGLMALGVVLWPAVAALVTGDQLGYFATRSAWGEEASWGPLVRLVRDLARPSGVAYVAVFAAATWWLVRTRATARLGVVLKSWCVVYLAYLLVTTGPVAGVLRHLLLAFPLAAVALGAAGSAGEPDDLPVRGVMLSVVGVLSQAWWVWHLLRFVPPIDTPP